MRDALRVAGIKFKNDLPDEADLDRRLVHVFAKSVIPGSDRVRGQHITLQWDVFNFPNLINKKWGADYQLPVGISNQNPVVQRVPLLNIVGFDQATKTYKYTVNENFGVFPKGGNPYQVQLSVRYGF